MRKSVGQASTAGEQTQQNPCRTYSDIGAEQENHSVGRGSTKDRKGLISGYRSFGTLRGTGWQLVADVADRCIIPKRR
jgi:hypothetical protein